MLLTIARSEIKNLLRDKLTLVMLLYPFLFGGLGKYLIDAEIVTGQLMGVIAVMLSIITGFAYGAMAGFSLLDDRDDQVLLSIQISPVPVRLYLWMKIGLLYLMAALANGFVIWFMGATDMGGGEILLVSLLAALQVPVTAFLVNAFAQNKVEGFVAMKGSGFILMLPAAAFFFLDAKEWLFAVAPGHWAAKAVQHAMLRPQLEAGLIEMNLSFLGYVGIGMLYNLLLIAVTYRVFQRKIGM